MTGSAWPWPSSETTGKVVAAFVAALQGVEDVVKSKRVDAGAMRYSYADLDAVLEAAKPQLHTNGLAVTQAATDTGVYAVVLHVTGEWLSFPPLHVTTAQNTPQGQGSAITYARRYQLLALLGIATEDDDGQQAGRAPRKAAAQRPANVTPDGEIQRPHPPARNVNATGDKPSPAQIRMAGALFNGRGWTDDDTRHRETSRMVGRNVDSWNDLSKGEMSAMLDVLRGEAVDA